MSKSKLANGNKALRERNLSVAMQFFVEAMNDQPGLSKIITGNIRQTQKFFKKEASSVPTCILVKSTKNSAKSLNTAIYIKHEITSVISIHDSYIIWNGNKNEFKSKNIGTFFSIIVSQTPTKYLYLEVINPYSLLLALLFQLIWKTQVNIFINQSNIVAIDKYFEHLAQLPTLAQIATLLNPVDLLLIKNLGTSASQPLQANTLNWPYRYSRLGQVHDELMGGADEQFVNNLFTLALGRQIQSHERKYFLEQMVILRSTRRDVAAIVFTGEESKRYISENVPKLNESHRVYSHPVIGDIDPADIDLPFHQHPKVSVLIPVYGKIEYTLACLQSIADYPPQTSFEVIVLDDQSPDGSVKLLQQVKNLRVVVNPQNLGFLRSCNNGACHAQGEYLFFLNNDTQVKSGWLDELVATFTTFPNCGLAGSKLIYPDGLLQEAGGIVWQDGSAWNYGSRQDPALPEFNYAREVDYISGAAILVPAKLFQDMGCFDERYAPAYYEDTDLAMRMREQGKSVIYQPLSEVVHFEGISSGTDTAQGVKAYQVVNQEKFLQRWKSRLAQHRPNGIDPHLERNRGAKGHVLFIDACTPTPDQDSGSIDSYNLMKVFINMGWAVSFIPEDNYAYMDKYTPMLQRIGVQMLYHPHVKSVDEHITDYGQSYNLVMAFRPIVTAKHIDNIRLRCPNAKLVFNTVDLHFLRLEREGTLKKDQELLKQSKELKELELALMKKADLTTVVSSVELEILEKMDVNKVVHLPFSREIRPSNVPFERRSGLIFVGGFQHEPNVDAVYYFVAEIMPELRKAIPGVVFNIVGSNTPLTIKDLACEDVIVHGFVENLEPLLDTVRLNIAPLRFGAGTKGKVVQAMANGLPTVGTSLAFEGMGIQDGITACLADTPILFVKKIQEIYNSIDIWKNISNSGIDYAKETFGMETLKINICRLITMG